MEPKRYTVLKPGSSRVSVGIRNLSCWKITVPAKSIITKVATANVVPYSLAPNLENNDQLRQEYEKFQQCPKQEHETVQPEITQLIDPPLQLTSEKEKLLLSKLDLTSTKNWSEDLIKETKILFRKYAHIFALASLGTDACHPTFLMK